MYIVQLCKILPIAATDGEQLVRKALYDAEISVPATSSLLLPSSLSPRELPSSLSPRERLVHSVSMTSKLKKQSALTTKNASKSSIKTFICPICEEAVVDPSSKNVGHDSIFCEGTCKAWLHRGCAGMSKTVFEKVCDTDDPFFCPYCRLISQGVEITSLKASLSSLLDELSSVKALVDNMNAKVSLPVPPPVHPLNPSSASEHGVSPIVPDPFPSLSSKPPSKSSHPQHESLSYPDRKYNVVLFGVEECKKGTSRSVRLQSGLVNAVSVLSSITPSVQSESVKDLFRLGKFDSSSQRPRPILVKLIRSADVSNVLANRGSLSPPFAIKPDRSSDERLKDSILLKERWKLIQSGISRKEIKIRNDRLFVHNKLYGKIFDSVFHPSSSDHVTISSQSKSSAVIIPDPLNNSSTDSTPATDPANGLANLSHSGSD